MRNSASHYDDLYSALAKGIVEVPVTEFDIRDGMPGVECHCPVVYAIQRRFSFLTRASIKAAVTDKIYIRISGVPSALAFWAPLSVGDFVRAFDNGQQVVPFTFCLKIEDGIRGGGLKGRDAARIRKLIRSRIPQSAKSRIPQPA